MCPTGGTRVYQLGLPLSQKLYMSLVHRRDGKPIEGDTFFPHDWQLHFPPEKLIQSQEIDTNATYHLTFRIYDRGHPLGPD